MAEIQTFDIPAQFTPIAKESLVDGMEVYYTLPATGHKNLYGPCWISKDLDKTFVRNKNGVRANVDTHFQNVKFWVRFNDNF